MVRKTQTANDRLCTTELQKTEDRSFEPFISNPSVDSMHILDREWYSLSTVVVIGICGVTEDSQSADED